MDLANSVIRHQNQQYATISSSSSSGGEEDDELHTYVAPSLGRPSIVFTEESSPPPTPPPPPPPPPPQKDWLLYVMAAMQIALAALFVFPMMPAPSSTSVMTAALPRYFHLSEMQHETTSLPVDLGIPRQRRWAREVVADLSLSLDRHKHTYECLCMHHTNTRLEDFKRICVLRPALGMVNPTLIGEGGTSMVVREHSVRCEKQRTTTRFQSIVVEWTDLESLEVFRATLSGRASACMQLALDEMESSRAHCSLQQ